MGDLNTSDKSEVSSSSLSTADGGKCRARVSSCSKGAFRGRFKLPIVWATTIITIANTCQLIRNLLH